MAAKRSVDVGLWMAMAMDGYGLVGYGEKAKVGWIMLGNVGYRLWLMLGMVIAEVCCLWLVDVAYRWLVLLMAGYC